LIVDFLGGAVKLNSLNVLSEQNRNSAGRVKASSKPDVLPKFRLGTSDVHLQTLKDVSLRLFEENHDLSLMRKIMTCP
jgi:hypothetical protein